MNVKESDVTAKTGGMRRKYIIHQGKDALRKKQNAVMRECLKCAILPEHFKSARSYHHKIWWTEVGRERRKCFLEKLKANNERIKALRRS